MMKVFLLHTLAVITKNNCENLKTIIDKKEQGTMVQYLVNKYEKIYHAYEQYEELEIQFRDADFSDESIYSAEDGLLVVLDIGINQL